MRFCHISSDLTPCDFLVISDPRIRELHSDQEVAQACRTIFMQRLEAEFDKTVKKNGMNCETDALRIMDAILRKT